MLYSFDWEIYFKYAWSDQLRNSLIVIAVLIIFAVIFGSFLKRKNPNAKPSKLQLIFEEAVKLVNTLTKLTIGKRWRKYSPYLLTIFLYLLIANITGLFLLDPPTSNWNIDLGLGLITFAMIHYTGVKSLGIKNYLKSYADPLPPYIPVFVPENIISAAIIPFSLSLRLFGNIVSGCVMSILIYGLLSQVAWGWVFIPIMPFFHAIFDLFFGAIQAVVFMLLTSVFIGQKVDEEELIVEQ